MLRIGVFARLGEVSTRTVRFYDEMGLLKPACVDEFTGYRYYKAEQLPCLNRILALKELGLSLDEIRCLVLTGRDLSADDLRQMLCCQQARVREETARLARVEARLRRMEQEAGMSDNKYEVVIKRVEPVLVAGIREPIPDMDKISEVLGRNFAALNQYVAGQGGKFAGPAFEVWYDREWTGVNMDVEAVIPIAAPVPESATVKVHMVEGVETAASLIHVGPFELLPQAHQAMHEWAHANDYGITGINREVYLEYHPEDPDKNVTEIQYPVTLP